ncbi:tannase/feruloyl esterase family alpha/beta hydrolase [Caballeronia insecticola]|uniref:tannase/feruloyl esterase family alpha/beta hydrolase n=1 Tax=Caballeronia insecticola TaxID=758793 RepID=UPI0003A176DD|nr:tannase/feruloyl esterase family alpha/beta hydrolase [Caballeronia insecticola]
MDDAAVDDAFASGAKPSNRKSRALDDFVRFYLMPGVGHGTGPFHPAIDSLSALDHWVESGAAPETLQMSDLNTAKLGRTRPLCRYPAWPKFVGGNVTDVASFSCVDR